MYNLYKVPIIDPSEKILPEISRVYSEFLLQPTILKAGFTSDKVDLSAPLAKFKYDHSKDWNEQTPHRLKIGFMTAPMQAVSSHKLAIETAKQGFLTTINCSQPIEREVEEIQKTKRVRGGFITPYVISPDMQIIEIIKISKKLGYGKYPVTEKGEMHGKVLGLLMEDLYDERHANLQVKDRMITDNGDWKYDTLQRYLASKNEINGDLIEANKIMRDKARSRILLIVDENRNLDSAVYRKDIEEHMKHKETELVDEQHRYMVAAAVNTKDYRERVPAVVDAGATYLVIDSSQGLSEYQAETIKWIREKYGEDVVIISGNYVTEEGFDFAINNGADAVKIGIGPGSICTTRTKFGIGCGQATALMNIAKRRYEYLKETGIYIPLIADGGVVTTSDMMKGFGMGADMLMMGRFFAGYYESPSEVENREFESKDGTKFTSPAKPYWGEGSLRAKEWRANRGYETLEGIEGWVPYKGRLNDTFSRELFELKEGIQKVGYQSIHDLHRRAKFILQSEGSIREGRPHDIYMKQS